MAAEFVQQFGFDLIFKAMAGTGKAHGTAMRLTRDLRGTAHDVLFVHILEQAHFVDCSRTSRISLGARMPVRDFAFTPSRSLMMRASQPVSAPIG